MKPMNSTSINNAELRKRIADLFCTDSEFDAFCIDNFPSIYSQFSNEMDRTQKIDLLLTDVSIPCIEQKLREVGEIIEHDRYCNTIITPNSENTNESVTEGVNSHVSSIDNELQYMDEFHALIARDPKHARRFFETFTPIFRAIAKSLLNNNGLRGMQLQEDLIQDVYEEIFKNDMQALRKWDPQRGTLKGFLRIFAHHRIRDQLRRRVYSASGVEVRDLRDLASLSLSDSEHALLVETKEFWQKYMAQFEKSASSMDRDLFRSFYIEGEKLENIAMKEKIPIQTLYVRLSRLRKFMLDVRNKLLQQKAADL